MRGAKSKDAQFCDLLGLAKFWRLGQSLAFLSKCVMGAMVLATLLSMPVPAGAQSGGPGVMDALATQSAVEAMATAQAIDAAQGAIDAQARVQQAEAQAAAARAQAAEQAAQATRQAGAMQAAQAAAQATSQAAVLQATISAAATRSAIEATATVESMHATATAQAQLQAAQATRYAMDAQATRAVYDLAIAQSQEQARVSQLLLYLAMALIAGSCTFLVVSWVLSVARRFEPGARPAVPPRPSVAGASAGTVGEVVIDVKPVPVPALPSPTHRMSTMHIVTDQRMIDAFRDYVLKNGVGDELTGVTNE
jgi:hypothetical protein